MKQGKRNRINRWIQKATAVCLLVAMLLTLWTTSAAAQQTESMVGQADNSIESILRSMTTEEKITQMLMIAPRYYDGVGVTQLNEPFQNLFSRYTFGGVILFAQNAVHAEQTLRLTDSLQKANAKPGKPQMFISIDQEGGSVSRLATGTQLTGNMALGAIGKPSAARRTGTIIGEELSALGINVDFAPVMDVNNNPANPVIGTRSFSDDPATVSALGTAFIEGLHSEQIMTALKHFPGHGDTGTDSHTGLPQINKTYAELQKNELIPFAAGIAAGAEMIMTAHIQFPKIENATYISKATGEEIYLPATLSKTILTDILRRDMGYDGIIVTDPMNMDAIAKHFDPVDSAVLAINAGVDILLMPVAPYSDAGIQGLKYGISALVALADSGKISMDNINASVRRILTLKDKHGLLNSYDAENTDARIADAVATVGSKAHHDEEFEIAKQSVTLTKNDNDLLPLREKNQKILILTANANEVLSVNYGKNLAADNSLLPKGAEITVGCYDNTPTETIDAQIKQSDVVIAISALTKAASLNPNTTAGAKSAQIDRMIATAHQAGAKFVILSDRLPYEAVRFPDADAVIHCWSDKGMREDPRELEHDVPQYGPCIPAAVYMMFAKNEKITGRLPVRVPQITQDYTFSDETALERGFGLVYKDFCPVCGESHEKNLQDRIQGLFHKILYAMRAAFTFLYDRGVDLFDRIRRIFSA